VTYGFATNDLVGLAPGVYNGQWTDTDAVGRVMHLSAGQFEVRTAF
jgi:hypothetical protein